MDSSHDAHRLMPEKYLRSLEDEKKELEERSAEIDQELAELNIKIQATKVLVDPPDTKEKEWRILLTPEGIDVMASAPRKMKSGNAGAGRPTTTDSIKALKVIVQMFNQSAHTPIKRQILRDGVRREIGWEGDQLNNGVNRAISSLIMRNTLEKVARGIYRLKEDAVEDVASEIVENHELTEPLETPSDDVDNKEQLVADPENSE